jgi:hypothetical protein
MDPAMRQAIASVADFRDDLERSRAEARAVAGRLGAGAAELLLREAMDAYMDFRPERRPSDSALRT